MHANLVESATPSVPIPNRTEFPDRALKLQTGTKNKRHIIVYGNTTKATYDRWQDLDTEAANARLRRRRAAARLDEKPQRAHLSDLGFTVPKQELYLYNQQNFRVVQTHADEPCAPRNFIGDYPSFPLKPHQCQLLLVGNDLMPIPRTSDLREFFMPELEVLSQTVFVRNFHMDPLEISMQLRAQYWPQHEDQESHKGKSTLSWLKRMAVRGTGFYNPDRSYSESSVPMSNFNHPFGEPMPSMWSINATVGGASGIPNASAIFRSMISGDPEWMPSLSPKWTPSPSPKWSPSPSPKWSPSPSTK
eukprot:Gregarina_sp_Poly_1__1575@NODE_139_length_13109_cov_53_487809_g124_i0_p7_GENE_NODE_139_length_13109_cov_53_487809_g124_i0NODE_139_length_13109_cov_53_487809_g124_i0_p7_ORF_typecomplete_len304_score49_91_NODE_139_length_13109_cov_53_487809_g124_i046055516